MSVYISQDGHCSSSRVVAREHGTFETFDTPRTKSDWIEFINANYPQSAPPVQPDLPAAGERPAITENRLQEHIDAALRNAQSKLNTTAEEQIQNGSFDDACRIHEQALGRINEHIRAAKRGEVL